MVIWVPLGQKRSPGKTCNVLGRLVMQSKFWLLFDEAQAFNNNTLKLDIGTSLYYLRKCFSSPSSHQFYQSLNLQFSTLSLSSVWTYICTSYYIFLLYVQTTQSITITTPNITNEPFATSLQVKRDVKSC